MSAEPTSDALNPIQPGPQGRVAESRIYRTPSNFRHVKERYTANFISVFEVARLETELIFKWAAGPEHKVAASSGSYLLRPRTAFSLDTI